MDKLKVMRVLDILCPLVRLVYELLRIVGNKMFASGTASKGYLATEKKKKQGFYRGFC